MAGIMIRRVGMDGGDLLLWRAYVGAHPDATPYHDPAWRRIFASFGYRAWHLLAVEGETGRPVGCLPLFLVPAPFARRLVAVPFRDRGGPLWSREDALEALCAEAGRLASAEGARFTVLKSVRPFPEAVVRSRNLREFRHWIRSRADLRGMTPETLAERLGPKRRNMIRQAEKAGLTFAEVRPAAAGAETWYVLHLETQRRLGLPPFPPDFFRRMLRELGPAGGIRLFVARRGATPAAATLVLAHRRSAVYAYSSSRTSAQPLRPNDFLLYHLLRVLIREGFEEFDLGSDSPAQTGLLFFKRTWLAEQSTIPFYLSGAADPAVTDSSAPRYERVRGVFRRLPATFLQMVGTAATRYFG